MKNLHRVTLAAMVAAALGSAPQVSNAADVDLKWWGDIYMKFLDGNRQQNFSMSNNFDVTPNESGGDQGQATEFDLTLTGHVSKQVEFYARIQSRLHRGFWANYAGYAVPGKPNQSFEQACTEADPRCNQYIKLRGARVIITPGYDWLDSASIGANDWGMFDAWTHGKTRYIDRDNLSGFLFQGSALDKTLRWDFARVSSPAYQGAGFTTGDLYTNDADYVGQLKYAPSAAWNATLIGLYASDRERDPEDTNNLNGVGEITRWENSVVGLKGQYSGLGFVDLKGAYYYSTYNIANSVCDSNSLESCRFSPLPKEDTDDGAFYLNLDFNRLFVDGLSLAVQVFDIGSDYVSAPSARREADVLLTEGQEGTWQWMRPDYNFGVRTNPNSNAGLGYGGWDGEVQQVVSGLADNDVTDFDETVAFSVIGWKGVTLVPKYQLGDWEFSGEYSYIDFNTNWQACGGQDKDVDCIYPRMEGTHAWGYGGDTRSPYAPYQDRQMEIFALKAKYTLDVGSGINLMARYKYISDEDDRVTKSSLLTDAYDGYPNFGDPGQINPDWVPNIGLGGCVTCDDREAYYDTYGISAGYQLTSDLYATLLYELHEVDLVDGTVDVAPVGMGFEGANAYGYAEYLTGDTTKNRVGMNFTYFLSGLQVGGTIDYFWGDYDPVFYTNDVDGRRVKLSPAGDTVATPLGNIPVSSVDLSQYRMKVWLKVVF
ncbi:MAG TPA: hypothetical protein VFI92_02900 [Steroidobacteraceae bacterium]|nr:hypothetical protein [Steroidobacteraceae bacterium]